MTMVADDIQALEARHVLQTYRRQPVAFVRGKGARVWDIDNVEYVDWGMGINNVLIGHAEDVIDDAAIAAIRNGQAFSRRLQYRSSKSRGRLP